MRIGLALSGGGIKGTAHIGAIKAFEENQIEISAVTGTSIGSIITVLVAMGYTADQMLDLFNYFAKDIFRAEPRYLMSNIKNSKRLLGYGALSGETIENVIDECAKYKGLYNITDIKMPIAISSVDIINCKKHVFTNRIVKNDEKYINNISIGKAVRASCSFPGLFAPCEFENYKFVDGGILDNVPVEELEKLKVDKKIAIKFPPDLTDNPKSAYDVAFKAIDVMFNEKDERAVKECDYVINVKIPSGNVFNVKKIKDCYNKGYIETCLLYTSPSPRD